MQGQRGRVVQRTTLGQLGPLRRRRNRQGNVARRFSLTVCKLFVPPGASARFGLRGRGLGLLRLSARTHAGSISRGHVGVWCLGVLVFVGVEAREGCGAGSRLTLRRRLLFRVFEKTEFFSLPPKFPFNNSHAKKNVTSQSFLKRPISMAVTSVS